MKSLLVRLLVSTAALWITSLLAQQLGLPLQISSASGAILAVIALAVINALIRPILKLLTLPLRLSTLGLISFLINALLFWSVNLLKIPGFEVGSFLAALFGSIVMGLATTVLNASSKMLGLR